MNAEIVYQVVKALSVEEQRLLFIKLNKEFDNVLPSKKKCKKKLIISDEEAIAYLIKNVFSKSKLIKK
ncbi:hypothetical protein MPF19_16625 [Polaribacter sp. Z014]|uniref:hypothetical protein n=1 Tax=Polaribacter sp. Z014 TaxID=2927126 RepID=UPI0020216C4A|nr:hypothetical protein [Polaribacter sp. Z014]MCL7765050.1 hypothetical protein [Polaribacter sp. Z014]